MHITLFVCTSDIDELNVLLTFLKDFIFYKYMENRIDSLFTIIAPVPSAS